MTHHNYELEAAEAEIEKLKAEIQRLHERQDEDVAFIRNLEVDVHTARRNLEQAEVDGGHEKKLLENEIRTLKDTIVKLATQQQQPSESVAAPGGNIQSAKDNAGPTKPIGTPASPSQASHLLSQMISAEEAQQEKDWLGE